MTESRLPPPTPLGGAGEAWAGWAVLASLVLGMICALTARWAPARAGL